MPAIVVALMSSTLTVMGQLLLKRGMTPVGQVPLGGLVEKLPSLFANPRIVIGLGIYGFSAFLWLSAISRMDLSLAYPLISLGIVLVGIASAFLLHESLDSYRIGGSVLIILGILVMTGTRR